MYAVNFDFLRIISYWGYKYPGWEKCFSSCEHRLKILEFPADQRDIIVLNLPIHYQISNYKDSLSKTSWGCLGLPTSAARLLVNFFSPEKYFKCLLFSIYQSIFRYISFHRFPYGQLVEINSHSLFSKWFSEVSLHSNEWSYCFLDQNSISV